MFYHKTKFKNGTTEDLALFMNVSISVKLMEEK